MAIRVWPAGPQKKHGAGQNSEPAGPCGPGPHGLACSPQPARAGPQARIKLKIKKTCTCVY